MAHLAVPDTKVKPKLPGFGTYLTAIVRSVPLPPSPGGTGHYSIVLIKVV